MHIIAYIYLFTKRSLPSFVQFYIAGITRIFPVSKLDKEKHITTCKALLQNYFSPVPSRSTAPFHNVLIPQIECFYSGRHWHWKTYYDRQKPRIIRLHLSRLIQSAERPSPVGNTARHPGFQYQRMLVDTSSCLPSLFNFLTPHMRFQSSSHTDVPVLKTQPSKERIK